MINRYPSHEEVEHLNKLLGFKATGNEQDWAIQFADHSRISEFLEVYLNSMISPAQKIEIMELIIASFDDLLAYENDNNELWSMICAAMYKDIHLFKGTLDYWGCGQNRIEDELFHITKKIRLFEHAL